MPRAVLFIADRFSDYRMWTGISDSLADDVGVIHLDERIQLPWDGGASAIVSAARTVLPADGVDVVVADGQAAPFAVALADAGLARSLVLFAPDIPFDRIPDDVDLDLEPPPDDVLAAYTPLADAMTSADDEQWRDLVVQVVRQTAPGDIPQAEVDLAVAIARDHAAEMRAQMLEFAAADARERELPDEVQLAHLRARGQWIDRLAALTVPVMTVVPARGKFRAETMSRIAQRHEIVLTEPFNAMAPGGNRAQAAAAIQRMLNNVS
jgi:hypothetical protein